MSIFSYLNRAALRRKTASDKTSCKDFKSNFLGYEIPDELHVLKEKFNQNMRNQSYTSNSYANRKSGVEF